MALLFFTVFRKSFISVLTLKTRNKSHLNSVSSALFYSLSPSWYVYFVYYVYSDDRALNRLPGGVVWFPFLEFLNPLLDAYLCDVLWGACFGRRRHWIPRGTITYVEYCSGLELKMKAKSRNSGGHSDPELTFAKGSLEQLYWLQRHLGMFFLLGNSKWNKAKVATELYYLPFVNCIYMFCEQAESLKLHCFKKGEDSEKVPL